MKNRFAIPAAQGQLEPLFAPDRPWLAPLAGYSDLPFRLLCRELGAHTCVTEMISAKGLFYGSSGTAGLLASRPQDQPLVVQLFGSDPENMAWAVLTLRRHGYRYFDCNMGCPVRKVMRQNAGAALLADQNLALAIARAMLAAANRAEPGLAPARVGFKLRLAPAGAPKALDLGRRLEDAGAAWLCLHPRFASDGYGGTARWEKIAELAEAVRIPVVASGDLMDAARGHACLAETGAATVMYARGALRNPQIFSQHADMCLGREMRAPGHAAMLAVIRRHVELSRIGDARSFRKIRSIIPRYVKNLAGAGQLRLALSACESWESLEEALTRFWEKGEGQ